MRVTTVTWKMSELLFETNNTIRAFQDYSAGQTKLSDLQERVEVLWSRVEVLQTTLAGTTPTISAPLSAMEHWLENVDPIVFSNTPLTQKDSLRMRAELEIFLHDVRNGWIQTHLPTRGGLFDRALGDMHDHDVEVDLTIFASVAGLLLYFMSELYFSRRAQRREQHLRHAALVGSQTKTNFLSNISHEIRTPLNGILGMVEGLQDSPLLPEQRESLGVIEKSSSLLLDTVNNVLEIAQLEAGSAVLRDTPFKLHQLINDIAEAFDEIATQKGLALSVSIAADVPSHIYGDPYRLFSVARHLISNAIKYTEKGEVRVALTCEEMDAGHKTSCDTMIVLSVTDTGIGIDLADTDSIFEPFNQVDNTMTRDYAGAGLGLALARQICWIMGGHLDVYSTLGEGSEFICRIPFRAAHKNALTEQPSKNTICRLVHGSSTEGDVGSSKTVPPTTTPLTPAGGELEHKGLNVLIVDDSRTNRMVLKKLLNDMDAHLYEAENGAIAVADFRDHDFDVVLMDIQMPVLDGVEAVRRIRKLEAEEGRKKSKIYAVTANVLPQQVKEYFAVGMDDVLPKPIKKHDILQRIRA